MTNVFAARTMTSAFLVVLVAGAACTMEKQEAPPLSGPSEFGQSINLAASPDLLPQDGASQSLITVTARGPNGEAMRNVSLRGEIVVNGSVPADFGTLSARNVVTGTDGRANFVYTAPPSPAVSPDFFTIVDILVTPIGTNFDNSTARSVSIRLTPQGTIIPHGDLEPSFTFTPSSPNELQDVLFDASASKGTIEQYRWNFGDGETGTGRTETHDFGRAGNYTVTLTLVDPYGRTESLARQVAVGAATNPTAAFAVSPTDPQPGQLVTFNATASRPAPGRTIVSYEWDFGDGGPLATGERATRTYTREGTYSVTLNVTDDAGRRGTVSRDVAVKFPETSLTGTSSVNPK